MKIGLVLAGIVGLILLGLVLFSSSGKSADAEVLSQAGLHWHPKLEIYINGEKQGIPSNIGLGTTHLPFHTHEDSIDGVLHMEFSGVVKKEDTRLANFFQNWGKPFNATAIMDWTNGSDGKVRFLVNGQENTDFENHLVKDKDQLEIRYE